MRKRIAFAMLARRKWEDMGKTKEEVQKASGMSKSTFNRRMRQPEDLTLLEVHKLDLILHFTDEEKVGLIDKIL